VAFYQVTKKDFGVKSKSFFFSTGDRSIQYGTRWLARPVSHLSEPVRNLFIAAPETRHPDPYQN
jgi:hypothetical protein